MPVRNTAQRGVVDWFLLGMLGAVLLASLAPNVGRSQGLLKLGNVTDVGVFLLFFLHGMGLSRENLKEGAGKWRLHALVQLTTYVAFPLWWYLLSRIFGTLVSPDLMMGFFYLAVLPSTVSSSVAMTALARGHVAAAVLNATLSILLGVWLTPLLVGFLLSGTGQHVDMAASMMKIAQMLLLPFAIGHLLRPWLASWFARVKPFTNVFDRAVIVMLVLVAFSDSVADGLWSRHGPSLLIQAFIGVCLFLFPMLWFTRWMAQRLGLGIEEEIVAVFCGSKKTLASGMPMAKLLFTNNPAIGVLVLPIMIYHQVQMFACAVLARRYAKRAD